MAVIGNAWPVSLYLGDDIATFFLLNSAGGPATQVLQKKADIVPGQV
ncbi:hypothetical protein GF1_16330 [Desulfolithobacter dissulfuricans]|uniref:Uncharacterized protein n=1 Tax=Desulfolithobacter dissulfuricans TaxID=2795293 RepID=A0A915U2F0_9BACT|nr:hypothetical protein GF1_16330 [Desulfolithobacter dissulfuricans]